MAELPVRLAIALGALGAFVGCTPTVNVATNEPIRIQLDVNITQEVRVQLADDVEELIAGNPDLF